MNKLLNVPHAYVKCIKFLNFQIFNPNTKQMPRTRSMYAATRLFYIAIILYNMMIVSNHELIATCRYALGIELGAPMMLWSDSFLMYSNLYWRKLGVRSQNHLHHPRIWAVGTVTVTSTPPDLPPAMHADYISAKTVID